MDEQTRSMNLSQVYRHGDGSLIDNTDLANYYAKLQDCIRRNCNENHHPNPFKFEKLNDSDLILLDSTYDDKLDCIKKCIQETESKTTDLQNALLEWVDRMSES